VPWHCRERTLDVRVATRAAGAPLGGSGSDSRSPQGRWFGCGTSSTPKLRPGEKATSSGARTGMTTRARASMPARTSSQKGAKRQTLGSYKDSERLAAENPSTPNRPDGQRRPTRYAQPACALPRSIFGWDQLLRDWRSVAEKASAELGLLWPRFSGATALEIENFVGYDLVHHRVNALECAAHPDIHEWTMSTYDAMLELARAPQSSSALKTLEEIQAASPRLSPSRAAGTRRGNARSARGAMSSHCRQLRGIPLSHPFICWLSVPANKKSSVVPGFSVLIRC
jgi:hypothetical protein